MRDLSGVIDLAEKMDLLERLRRSVPERSKEEELTLEIMADLRRADRLEREVEAAEEAMKRRQRLHQLELVRLRRDASGQSRQQGAA